MIKRPPKRRIAPYTMCTGAIVCLGVCRSIPRSLITHSIIFFIYLQVFFYIFLYFPVLYCTLLYLSLLTFAPRGGFLYGKSPVPRGHRAFITLRWLYHCVTCYGSYTAMLLPISISFFYLFVNLYHAIKFRYSSKNKLHAVG